MLLDVGFYGNEILLDELCGFLIFVRLGIQPSTGPSSGRRAEIQKDGPVLLLGLVQRLVNVFTPVDRHVASV
jgi:hypothetical protein